MAVHVTHTAGVRCIADMGVRAGVGCSAETGIRAGVGCRAWAGIRGGVRLRTCARNTGSQLKICWLPTHVSTFPRLLLPCLAWPSLTHEP